MSEITAERCEEIELLRTLLRYVPETGDFIRLRDGKRLGKHDTCGYVQIRINAETYSAGRLAWAIAHGEWPAKCVDHINRIRDDNRLCNLRLATVVENQWNTEKRRDNTTGFKGVYRRPNGRFQAAIRLEKRFVTLGTFDTAEQASAAYQTAAVEHHGQFARSTP